MGSIATERAFQEAVDRLQILNLLAGSALSSDVSSQRYQEDLYAEEAVLDRHAEAPEYRGRNAIAGIMADPDHLAQVEWGMVHLSAQPYVLLNGDSAVACGYLQVMRAQDDSKRSGGRSPYVATPPDLWMITANVWQFQRENGRWLLHRRTIRDALTEAGRALIREVLEAQ